MRYGRRLRHVLRNRLRPIGGRLYRILDRGLLQYLRRLAEECRKIGADFAGIKTYLGERRGFSRLKAALKLPALAVKRHRPIFRTAGNLLLAAVGIVLMVISINYWNHREFALRVIYRGESVGYIGDELTYEEAADLALGRVINNDGTFTVDRIPNLSLSAVSPDEKFLSKEELCDSILRSAGDSITEMTGLYVDGNFEGAVVSKNELLALLRSIKEPFLTGAENERAEFVQNVQVVDGLFPVSSNISIEDLTARLTGLETVDVYYTVQRGDSMQKIARANNMDLATLRSLNPTVKNDYVYVGEKLLVQQAQAYLQVQTVRTFYTSEKIQYPIEKSYNTAKNVLYERVIRNGTNGKRDLVTEVTYRNGMEISREVVSSTVATEPITKLIEVGTQPVKSSSGKDIVQGDGIATGTFMWPVPICHHMSRGWGNGHQGLDISNGPVTVNKKPFVAADGGVVKGINTGGWGGGYGLYVVIDHGNGMETLYAHCSSLCVVLGQKVSKGQQLGTIGSTGQSSGPHLHFEIWKNHRRVNPLLYVKP